MSQFEKRNLSMMMDLYQLTMANGYFKENLVNNIVSFDVFYRKNPDGGGFSVFAGLEQVIDFIINLHFNKDDITYLKSLNLFDDLFLEYLSTYRFTGDVDAFKEGTIMYPNVPILTVTSNIIDAILIETAILAQINHQSLIATKARRIVKSAKGRGVVDFGARRAHNMDAAVYGARASYIGGVNGTSNVLAGKLFNIPVVGTMAHSWVMNFDCEYDAFKKYATSYPDATVLLVDTYDVINMGIPNAIKVAKEVLIPMGKRLKGVRLDSGDLAYLSKKVRKMLDDAGLEDCNIIVSNSLDEHTISSILNQEGAINSFGVGERLITAKSDAVFGAVYKISAVKKGDTFIPRIKVSETIEKITNPGRKMVYRIYDKNNHAVADLITNLDEIVDVSKDYTYIEPSKSWEKKVFTDCTAKQLLIPVIRGGKVVCELPNINEIKAFVKEQLDNEIWHGEQRFENPHIHYVNMSEEYYNLKFSLLAKSKNK